MAQAPPTALSARHLSVALLPDDVAADAAEAHYARVEARVDGQFALAELWSGRVSLRPDPPQPATLEELVQAARQRLRRDRLRVDRDELDARRFVLRRVRAVLSP